MLYLAIDQHKNHLTINIRNEQGDVLQKGQIPTKPDDIDEFFVAFAKKARKHRGYMAIVEVCGFNDWLLEKFKKTQCKEIVVIQPDHSAVNKTDKRDADALGVFLWNNRKRLEGGQRPNGIRRIFPADPDDAQVRQLVNFRQHLVKQRTRMSEPSEWFEMDTAMPSTSATEQLKQRVMINKDEKQEEELPEVEMDDENDIPFPDSFQ